MSTLGSTIVNRRTIFHALVALIVYASALYPEAGFKCSLYGLQDTYVAHYEE